MALALRQQPNGKSEHDDADDQQSFPGPLATREDIAERAEQRIEQRHGLGYAMTEGFIRQKAGFYARSASSAARSKSSRPASV